MISSNPPIGRLIAGSIIITENHQINKATHLFEKIEDEKIVLANLLIDFDV